MDFEFGREVKIKNFTVATGMTGILHKDCGDGTFDILLVHGQKPDMPVNPHAGVLVSVVPVNMPSDVIESL